MGAGLGHGIEKDGAIKRDLLELGIACVQRVGFGDNSGQGGLGSVSVQKKKKGGGMTPPPFVF
jgi:hypothetical protein